MIIISAFLIISVLILIFLSLIYLDKDKPEPSKGTKNQLSQLQHQNIRYQNELRILNKKYRRALLLNRKL